MSADLTCKRCNGTGRDDEHRHARFMRLTDALDCSIHGDHGWDYSHGDCEHCDGTGSFGEGRMENSK